jgi:hypothetical protein
MSGRVRAALAAGLLACVASPPAAGFVATPVGGRPQELDVNLQATAERGKIEPNENQASWVPARGYYEYKLGVGYTWGHYGPLQFFSTRLEATYYTSPAEKNDPEAWFIDPAVTTEPDNPECTSGARHLGDGVCEFHPEDQGTLITGTVSFAVAHDPKFALGLYFKSTVPIGMDLRKFANPRLDYFAGGTQLGVELTSWLSYESILFIGSGTRPFGTEQNGAIGLTNLFHARTRRWLLPWKAGIKLGPYVEGDLHERFDDRYDRAYSPIQLPQPGATEPVQHRDRIRAARFAVASLPYFLVTEHVSVELGYIQKFFGYDARATQVWFAGVRGLLDLGE